MKNSSAIFPQGKNTPIFSHLDFLCQIFCADAPLGSVKFICSNAAGYDAIDIHAAARRGIYVSNTPGAVDTVRLILI